MAKRRLVTDGVLVQLRAGCHWRNRATGKVYTGPTGKPGTAKYNPGSGPFRIPALRWEREVHIGSAQSIVNQVGDDDTAD